MSKGISFKQFSPAQLAERATALPVVTYPDLPVSARRDDIAAAIRDHQVVIVSGETGSGKTTQIPKICLQLGRGISGLIGHTQPRRLAARAVAERIAEELGGQVGPEPGRVIGYQVRFTDEVGPTTLVKLMTDGILLNEIHNDPDLLRYDTLIIDEAHERSLNIDFILGYLTRVLPRRPDLKVIITSATIDADRFAEHFARQLGTEVPVITVTGRTYPVEIRYRPLSPDLAPLESGADEEPSAFQQLVLEDPRGELPVLGYGLGEDIDIEQGICEAVGELLTEPDGDILVFLPGERDIRETQAALAEYLGPRYTEDGKKQTHPGAVEVIALFARLSAAEQHRIFQPHSRRRIILSTNIAETSLTVPGIRYIIDPGLARISRFSNKTKVQRLPIEPISQASANQRAGRAGRLSDGIAIRLFSARDYRTRAEYTEPEILRTSLASVILQMTALGLGEVADFPFIDAPSSRAVKDGVQLLVEIGGLTEEGSLTKVGWKLARLPIDPRLGRMLLAGEENGCASELLVIVAALSIQDVRERPLEMQAQADASHHRFADPRSDFVTYLNLWRYLNVQARDLSGSQFRRRCRAEFLHYLRFREWRDVVGQLRHMCRSLGMKVEPLGEPSRKDISQTAAADPVVAAVIEFGKGKRTVDADEVHRALLVGLLSNLGNWDEVKHTFLGARGTRFTIWPGSALTHSHPAWVMAAELVETSRLFARTVAAIKPEWIEPAAQHLLKRSYSEPYWSRSQGAAMVKEKVTLYGMTLVADRQVLLGRLSEHSWKVSAPKLSSVAKPGTVAGIAQGLLGNGGKVSTPWLSLLSGAEDQELTAVELARELFIRHALVGNDWRAGHLGFVRHNQRLLEEARELEKKSRRPGTVADEEARFAFFDERIPTHIVSAKHFESWWKKERTEHPHLLGYTLADLLPAEVKLNSADYPSQWRQRDLTLTLDYDFNPGSAGDGVSVTIPLEVLPRVHEEGFDWLVPGMLPQLCAETIRSLPKDKRRLLAPAPDVGAAIAKQIRAEGPWEEKAKRSVAVPPPSGMASAGSDAVKPDRIARPETIANAEEVEEVDPRSLEASLDRLQAWGGRAGTMRGDRQSKPLKPVKQSEARTSKRPQEVAASAAAAPVTAAQEDFFTAFSRACAELRGVELTDSDRDYAQERLPLHLQVTFVVTQGRKVIATGKSLAYLRGQLAKKADTAVRSAVKSALREARTDQQRQDSSAPVIAAEQNDLIEFPAQPLPRQVESRVAGGLLVRAYPALIAQGSPADPKVGVHSRPLADVAAKDHRQGLAYLLTRTLRLSTARITTRWGGREALLLASSSYPSTEALVNAAQVAAALSLVDELSSPTQIRSAGQFKELVTAARDLFEDRVYQILAQVVKLLEAVSETEGALLEYSQESLHKVSGAVRSHTHFLVGEGFLERTPFAQLPHLPRYVRAGAIRLARAARSVGATQQDREKAKEIGTVEVALLRLQANADSRPFSLRLSKEIDRLQWLIEELRVSQFAEQLGTSERVSVPRLLRQIETAGQS